MPGWTHCEQGKQCSELYKEGHGHRIKKNYYHLLLDADKTTDGIVCSILCPPVQEGCVEATDQTADHTEQSLEHMTYTGKAH